MKTEQIARLRIVREEMIYSYIEAIKEAGGDPKMFLEQVDNMTVAEMINILAQNGVRFYFDVNGRISE